MHATLLCDLLPHIEGLCFLVNYDQAEKWGRIESVTSRIASEDAKAGVDLPHGPRRGIRGVSDPERAGQTRNPPQHELA